MEYVPLVKKDHSALLATLIALGLERTYFEEASGLAFGVEHYKYESGVHHVPKDDRDRLRALIAQMAESEPEFWSDYSRSAASIGSRLISTSHSLANAGGDEHSRREDLAEGFTAYGEAAKAAAPFVATTPQVINVLESVLARAITDESKRANTDAKAEKVLAGLRLPREASESRQEIRSCYRIALEIAKNQEVLDVVRDKFAGTALSRIESDFPELHELIRYHVDEYGWIRAQGGKLEPTSARELVERIQKVLLRWKRETVQQAAEPSPSPNTEQILGFSPSESLARLIGALQDLYARRWFRIEAHLQAESIARPFLTRVAESLGCTLEQLMFGAADEIGAALAQRKQLPLPEIDRRIRDGFGVERSRHDLEVSSLESASRGREEAERAILTGQSVSLGRAVGAVKIIFEPMEVLKLELGDVLVTSASTPDKMGTESAFPGRTDAPLGLENAAAIVTDEGGLLSHAAIISRELGIPCVVGTERATSVLVEGQVVEVDATRGAGRVIALESS